jgi:hypothetical protein
LISNRYTKKVSTHLTALTIYNLKIFHKKKMLTQLSYTLQRQYMWHRRTTMTSFRNIVNIKILIAVVWKAQQLPLISMLLMMAK